MVVIVLFHIIGDIYLFENVDYDQFNSELIDLDWNELFCDLRVKEMWQCFHSTYIVNY